MPPSITFGQLIIGFPQWYNTNFNEIQNSFTSEAQELFETIEDFAVELFHEINH